VTVALAASETESTVAAGDLDGGVERGRVWMACDCGALFGRPAEEIA